MTYNLLRPKVSFDSYGQFIKNKFTFQRIHMTNYFLEFINFTKLS